MPNLNADNVPARFPITIQRTDRLTIMVEGITAEDARAQVVNIIRSHARPLDAYVELLFSEAADEHTHPGVHSETDNLEIL